MIHQVRIYEIFEHNKSAFHARFRDHAMRIMRKYGFDAALTYTLRLCAQTLPAGNNPLHYLRLAWIEGRMADILL